MTVSASTQIPKTSDPAIFQRQCKVLFEHVLNDPNVKEFGSSGDTQGGIDLLGRRRSIALDHWVGIQCKLTIKAAELRKGIIRKEAEKAISFDPTLKEFILVTTADDSAKMDAEGAAVSNEQAKLGRDFTVQVWGWQTLQTHILQHEAAINAFSPDSFPTLQRLSRTQDKIVEDLNENAKSTDEILAIVQRIELTQSASMNAAIDGTTLDTIFDRQIDQFRDLMKGGRPRTAETLLQNLWETLPDSVDGRIRFRVKANLAACQAHLGNAHAAGALYLEAYDFAPEDPKAPAFKVFGLTLLDRPTEAWAFGKPLLDGAADQTSLVIHLIGTARQIDENPLELISDSLKEKAEIAVAMIEFQRVKERYGDWRELSHIEHSRHPDNDDLARLAAEATLDRGCAWFLGNSRSPLPQPMRQAFVEATEFLKRKADDLLTSEEFERGLSICLNCLTAYRILGQHALASQTVDAWLKRLPNDPHLLEQRMLVALEAGDVKIALDAMETLPNSRDVTFGRLQSYANDGEWEHAIDLISKTNVEELDTEDRAFIESVKLLALYKSSKLLNARSAVSDLLGEYPEQIIIPIITYDIAAHSSDAEWATSLFQIALTRISTVNSASRSMLARIAQQEDDAETIVNLLDGHVDLHRDSADLRLLARGFVNAAPRKASIDFATRLSPDLSRDAFFTRVIGSIQFNAGALEEAEAAFRAAIDTDALDARSHLGLIDTWVRQDRRDLISEHLSKIQHKLPTNGTPVQKLRLSYFFLMFKFEDVGLALAYETIITNRDDAQAAQLYIGLMLPGDARIPPTGPTVEVNDWVSIERADGLKMEIVIEAGKDRASINHYGPTHQFAQTLLKKSKGETVEVIPAAGSTQQWTIVDFKHKFAALLSEIMATFAARFPDERGFYQFDVRDDDISPILEEVKRHSERDDEIYNFYTRDRFPIALVSAILGKSSIEFASDVLHRGETIKTCLGTLEERTSAIRCIVQWRNRGIVLDTYTAWIAYSLGIIPVLKVLFGQIAAAQSSFDELSTWRNRYQRKGDKPAFSVGYRNGSYFRQEISPDELDKSYRTIDDGINYLRRELKIFAAAAPTAPSAMERSLLDFGSRSVLDAAYISSSENLLLVSDDMGYRNLHRQLFDRDSVWLQSILMVGLAASKMDIALYCKAISGLASQRHDFVTFNASVLVALAGEPEVASLEVVSSYLSAESADLKTNINVAWEFLIAIWQSSLPLLQQQRAAGVMLDRLATLLFRHGPVGQAFGALINDVRTPPILRRYVRDWARGHFIKIPR